jgi:spermidine/putrescine transport system substrate-binding protein
MVVPKGAADPKLSHAFMNFFLDPEVAAENMEWMGYLCPNTAALKKVDKEFLKNPAITIPDEVKAKCEALEDLGADLPKWTKAWDEVKAAN